MLRKTFAEPVLELDASRLETLIAESRLEEAAEAMNEKYREISGNVLDVFEDLLECFVTSTFRGDLEDLRGLIGAGLPSRRKRLRSFLSAPAARNCLTAVLTALEKEVPHGVSMGFTDVPSFFRKSEFAATYSADIINYEPELKRLTDQRLVRLLSQQANSLDLGSLDAGAIKMKERVLEAYRKESLEPLKGTFLETAGRCRDFLAALERHALAFRKFFDAFASRGFEAEDGILAEWSSLGEEFFHLEQRKSSLMLPISPKALYWGMQGEYSETLSLLKSLKDMVTPDFSVREKQEGSGDWVIEVECLNPQSLRGDGFVIEPRLRYATIDILERSVLQVAVDAPDSPRRCRISIGGRAGPPRPLTLRITCEARFYQGEFRTEKHFLIGEPGGAAPHGPPGGAPPA